MIVRHAPAGSAIARAMHPEVAAWANGEVNAQLLALIGDMLAEGNWQRARRKKMRRIRSRSTAPALKTVRARSAKTLFRLASSMTGGNPIDPLGSFFMPEGGLNGW